MSSVVICLKVPWYNGSWVAEKFLWPALGPPSYWCITSMWTFIPAMQEQCRLILAVHTLAPSLLFLTLQLWIFHLFPCSHRQVWPPKTVRHLLHLRLKLASPWSLFSCRKAMAFAFTSQHVRMSKEEKTPTLLRIVCATAYHFYKFVMVRKLLCGPTKIAFCITALHVRPFLAVFVQVWRPVVTAFDMERIWLFLA